MVPDVAALIRATKPPRGDVTSVAVAIGRTRAMNRRDFIAGCAGAAVLPWPARGQGSPRLVGIWWSPVQARELLPRYRQRLAELGWVEGRNIRYELRVWDGDIPNMRRQADD